MYIKLLIFFIFFFFFSLVELKEICELIGIDQSVLERAFSFRTVEAKQEKVSTTLNVSQVNSSSVIGQCQLK